MLIDPLKQVNKHIDEIKLNNRMDKVVNDIIDYLIEEYSSIIGTAGFGDKNGDAVMNIIREKINKDYNYNNFDTEELVKVVFNKLFGYGILEKHLINKEISDIRVVKWNSIYVMRKGTWEKVEDRFANETEFYNFVRYCVLKNNGRITYEQPIVVVSDKERHLRIEAGISPVNIISPSLVIRIHRPEEKLNLEELFYQHYMFDEKIYKFLCNAINNGDNIVIAGKGGSGKTTLLRAILNKIPDNVSITSNEETAELYSTHGNIIQREIVKNRNKGNILLEDLTRQSLVMSNDAIVIGEIKGAEAMSFFDGISTGHIGYATVHADSSSLVMDRLVTLIKKDILAQQYSDKYLKNLLAQSLDVIIYMKNFKIHEICTVKYVKENDIECRLIFKYDENIDKFISQL